MEFWGVEVKVGETVKVDPEEFDACIHLSQAALGEAKKDKGNDSAVLYVKVGDQKFVFGTLTKDKIPQLSLDLVLEKKFELSHTSKSASVFFCGYKAFYNEEDSEGDDFSDSGDDEDIPLLAPENGKPETKAIEVKGSEAKKAGAKNGAPAKQVKVVEPKKDEEEDSEDDSDDVSGSSDEEMDDADSDEDDDDDVDSDEAEEEDTPTPKKKPEQGKKRANDSAAKTPVSAKKAKNATPEKTVSAGKKSGHTDTPHPVKKGGKTPKSDGKSPKSGGLSCNSCSKAFNSESGLQQHNKAKHGQ